MATVLDKAKVIANYTQSLARGADCVVEDQDILEWLIVQAEKAKKLEDLCEAQFKEPMTRPYAGANLECFFCGASEGRGMETEHTETCPFLAYKEIIGLDT